jgi:hypothetical protein
MAVVAVPDEMGTAPHGSARVASMICPARRSLKSGISTPGPDPTRERMVIENADLAIVVKDPKPHVRDQ